MRHSISGNELSAILNTLNALAAVASRRSAKGEGPGISAIRTGESWVDRISKEKWVSKNGLSIASAVVAVGAILYGTRKLLRHDKSDEQIR
jgi:hypothetical protein